MKPFNSSAFNEEYMCAGGSFPQRIKEEPNEPYFCGYEGKQNNFGQALNCMGQAGIIT